MPVAQGERFRVTGVVQGVGFRPTVWRIANSLHLSGQVLNDGEGVLIDLWGLPDAVECFIRELEHQCPPLATIESIERTALNRPCPVEGFTIAASESGGHISAGVPADAAVCPACIEETLNPASRRYRYPFTNCTHCGPRLSIIKTMPYDRPGTSMAPFRFCKPCKDEYDNPADRRFHAQPVACPECGPKVWLSDAGGQSIDPDTVGAQDAIEAAARLIAEGKIVAVRGLGGFHLACDATNPESVAWLRERKQRPAKPFAVMVKSIETAAAFCEVSPESEKLLAGSASPIVLMPVKKLFPLVEGLAPGLGELGMMLPTSPLHLLLCRDADVPLVMTSANLSGNPQCTGNKEALADLAGIADAWLLHNREIVTRVDDSVIRQTAIGPQLLRRGRGYAPLPVRLPKGFEAAPATLALGGEVKNAFCLTTGQGAVVSQYIGDLESVRVWDDFEESLSHYQSLYRFAPEVVAVDSHPEYLASKLAREAISPGSNRLKSKKIMGDPKPSNQFEARLIEVQHHHAHVAACMADNGLEAGHPPVLGVVFDGLGYGDDGTIWGGEFLLADYRSASRIGHLKTASLPGGVMAVRQPWRNLVAALESTGLSGGAIYLDALENKPVAALGQMIAKGINSPVSSSVGRLFDAVAAAVGIAPDTLSYEGEAAILLEAQASRAGNVRGGYRFGVKPGECAELDPTPMWQALLEDIRQGEQTAAMAYRFHAGLAYGVADMIDVLRAQGPKQAKVVLSGGVFQNRLLLEMTVNLLTGKGIEVLVHRQVPANDGGLALGQAVVAMACAEK